VDVKLGLTATITLNDGTSVADALEKSRRRLPIRLPRSSGSSSGESGALITHPPQRRPVGRDGYGVVLRSQVHNCRSS
jgi:hypothetical protein